MFDVAIYTDTRASEAIDGIDGFNFQAVSEGITAQDRQVIRDNMLHRVVVGWSVDHDPLAHPPSFAYYNHAGRFYLSRGISSGVTNNGRPGNLLTQAITTSESDDFGAMRPAQLFGAVKWDLKKAADKHIGQWATPLEIASEFEADALCQMVKSDTWATKHLTDFLSMIEQVTAADPKRLVIITGDQVLAQRWIALGTLFVDAHRAFSLTIRGLVQDPMTTKGDIIAASPEFGPQPDATVPRTGVNVVDLEKHAMSPVEHSESALTQAGWFLNEDSGAALAAIDVARRWEQFLGRDLATRAAAIACFSAAQGSHDGWLVAMNAIRLLAHSGQTDELFFYGDALLDTAVTYAPQMATDAELAGEVLVSLLTAGVNDLALGVLMPTLEALSSIPSARDPWINVLAGAPAGCKLTWDDEEARQQASAYVSRMADEVPDSMLPALYSGLQTLDIPLAEMVRPRTNMRLAGLWASQPSLASQCERWKYLDEVMHELCQTLIQYWDSGNQMALNDLVKSAWSWLPKSPALSSLDEQRMAPWFTALKLSRLTVADCQKALPAVGILPEQSWTLLWGSASITTDFKYFITWVETQSVINQDAGSWLMTQVQRVLDKGKPAIPVRRVLLALGKPNVIVKEPHLLSFAMQVAQATSYFENAMRNVYNRSNRYLEYVAGYVPTMAPLMVDYLGEIILASEDVKGVSRVVDASKEWAEVATRYALDSRRNTEQGISDAVTWALILYQGNLDAPAQAAQDFLQDVCDNRRDSSMIELAAKHKLMDRTTKRVFDDFAKVARKGHLTRRFKRAASDLLSGKGKED